MPISVDIGRQQGTCPAVLRSKELEMRRFLKSVWNFVTWRGLTHSTKTNPRQVDEHTQLTYWSD